MSFHQHFAEWSQWFWPLFVNHLWQATLFALLVWGAMGLLRQAAPRVRHAAWMLALAKFLLPAAALAAMIDRFGWRSQRLNLLAEDFSSGAMVLLEAVEPAVAGKASTSHGEAYCALTAIWLVGAFAVFAFWQFRRWRFSRGIKSDSVPVTGRVAELSARLQRELGIEGDVPLLVSAQAAGPGLWGIWRPKIVLPPDLETRLNDEELAAVLLHELIHLRQRDNRQATAQMMVCCLLWFHPLVWLIDRRLIGERELICDEGVIRFGSPAEIYAAGLWKVVQHGLGWPVAGVSRVAGSNLKRRIEIMLNPKRQVENSLLRRLTAGATLCALLTVAVATTWLMRGNVQASSLALPEPLQQAVASVLPSATIAAAIVPAAPKPTPTPVKINQADDAATMPSQQPVTIELPFENAAELPIAITGAKLTIGAAIQVKHLTHDSVDGREAKLEIQLHKSDSRRVTNLAFTVKNQLFWGGRDPALLHDVSDANSSQGAANTLTVVSRMSFESRLNGLELMDCLQGFRLELKGVQFEGETAMAYVQGDENNNRILTRMTTTWTAPGKLKLSFRNQEQQAALPEQEQSPNLRPVILYKTRAHYTKEARDQKVEGVVSLDLTYGADGQIRDIRVVRGLPYGLTESAIEAAQAIRFEPGTKGGQPKDVRGRVEFSFRLEETGN